MWVGLFSDIHANREALSRLVCLGDYVGYGADPAYVVDRSCAKPKLAP